MKEELILDERLTHTMDRIRNGRTQLFREKNNADCTFIDENNCDVKLEHENKAMYAEFIDSKWYWVNGCGPCNGEARSWKTYIECDKHDVCKSCNISRKEIEGSAWGSSNGWQCNICKEVEDKFAREEAFEKLDGEEPDCTYCDEIICPHCGNERSKDDIYESQELYCFVCEGKMHLEVEYTASYSTSIVGKRITKSTETEPSQ